MLRWIRPALVLTVGALVTAAMLSAVATPAEAREAPQSTRGEISVVGQGVGDFTFDSFNAEYTLGLDADGRSTLTTTETIVARFPEIDQNKGIRRAIPTHYQGHPTDIALDRVIDGEGRTLAFDTETTSEDRDQEFLEITIAAGDFVHGPQTYSITYSQSNVTLYPSNSKTEQFYWDVNGSGWDQSFVLVSATVHFDPALVPQIAAAAVCFKGSENSKTPCDDILVSGSSAEPVLSALASNLGPRENLTIAAFFEPGTFVPRDDSFTANALPGLGLAGAALGLITALLAGIMRATRWRSAAGRFTIIAEYLPPRGVNLLTSGEVTGTASKAMAAQFVSFAVRGNVRILEAGDKKNHFLLEFRHANGVDETESRILGTLFPGLQTGDQRDLTKKSASLTKALQKERTAARVESLRRGLREKKNDGIRTLFFVLAIVMAGVGLVGSLGAMITVVGGFWPLLFIVVSIPAAVATFVFAGNFRPLTAEGAELRDYLKGVKLYISLAEADRLRVLQSPEGAVRSLYRPDTDRPYISTRERGDSTTQMDAPTVQIVKLYERVLPLAVLFGEEKDWSGVLSHYYAENNTQPDWYFGSGMFQAAFFAGAISSFATTTTTSWSGSATSSSSSGGGGGGFSGGGGGGGGGGGV